MVDVASSSPTSQGAPHRDFPFYAGEPVDIGAQQWLLVMVAVAAGFTMLVIPIPALNNPVGGLARAILFVLIPFGTLHYVSNGSAWCLLSRLKLRDVGLMLAVAVLNLVVTVAVALIVRVFWDTEVNPVFEILAEQTPKQLGFAFIVTSVQLVGEELLTILPFLALLTLFYRRFNFSRRQAMVIAWLASALIFGMVHLPTYQWHWVQCLLIIGTARLVLTLAYLKSKNLLVSAGAHIINDWTLFSIAIMGQRLT